MMVTYQLISEEEQEAMGVKILGCAFSYPEAM
jgi:hypothetical protein